MLDIRKKRFKKKRLKKYGALELIKISPRQRVNYEILCVYYFFNTL